MEKLPFCKSVLESTWLYHEIGRCHLELKYYQDAKEFGQKSLAAAEQADDKVWQLNATVLVGQAEGKFQSEINPWGGGGSTPLHKPHRYVPPKRVWFLGPYAHFGLESGIVFKRTTGEYECSYHFNSF